MWGGNIPATEINCGKIGGIGIGISYVTETQSQNICNFVIHSDKFKKMNAKDTAIGAGNENDSSLWIFTS